MSSIPEPTPRQLAAMYPRGQHPVIDRAESAMRAFGALTRPVAERLLSTWAHRGDLTDRERAATLARFPEALCETCQGAIEYVPKPPNAGPAWGPAYWRHTRPGAASHAARPAVTE